MSGEPMLIVDDNLVNLKLIKAVLSTEEYEVRTAMTADEALNVLETFHPRLILMDIQLPGMDGLALTQHLKSNAETRDIIIVALTAYAMKGDDERARASGCSGYITKPIDIRTFPGEVAKYLKTVQAGDPS